ncbi:hypothetical protein [Paenibacillus pini]|nr:hypothetical protein [Paenibacillus pini]
MPFERPTQHYDERILHIDEQICELLKQRKEISNNNPGYPPFEYIEKWSISFGLYEDYLKEVFGAFRSEEFYKPVIEPQGFRKHIPILKSLEYGGFFYSLISVRQYSNASVITFNMDWDITRDHSTHSNIPIYFELYVGEEYDCRMDSGTSTSGHSSHNYVISPPLPDDISGMEFIFRKFKEPFENNLIGTEINEIILRAD